MKIYNKKGFAAGVLSAVLGIVGLVLVVARPRDMAVLNVKHVVVNVALLLVGVVAVVRSFSRSMTREDVIEETDERNVLVRLKASARAFDIVFAALVVVFLASVVAFFFTGIDLFVGLFVFAGLFGVLATAVQLATTVYYERHV